MKIEDSHYLINSSKTLVYWIKGDHSVLFPVYFLTNIMALGVEILVSLVANDCDMRQYACMPILYVCVCACGVQKTYKNRINKVSDLKLSLEYTNTIYIILS